MRQILHLWFAQLRYLALMLLRPTAAREYWYLMYHASRRADKLVQPSLKHRLPIRDIEEIFPGLEAQPFSLEGYCEEYGAVSLQEIKVLAASIQMLKPRALFEIGTFHGGTTVQLAINSPQDAVVNTLDLPEDHPLRAETETVDLSPQRLGKRHRTCSVASKVRQHYGNSMEFDFSAFARAIDWVFVDAAHTYEYVMSDTKNALAIVRPGGVIFWHDVNLAFDGTCQAIAEYAERLPIVRVRGTTLACYRA